MGFTFVKKTTEGGGVHGGTPGANENGTPAPVGVPLDQTRRRSFLGGRKGSSTTKGSSRWPPSTPLTLPADTPSSANQYQDPSLLATLNVHDDGNELGNLEILTPEAATYVERIKRQLFDKKSPDASTPYQSPREPTQSQPQQELQQHSLKESYPRSITGADVAYTAKLSASRYSVPMDRDEADDDYLGSRPVVDDDKMSAVDRLFDAPMPGTRRHPSPEVPVDESLHLPSQMDAEYADDASANFRDYAIHESPIRKVNETNESIETIQSVPFGESPHKSASQKILAALHCSQDTTASDNPCVAYTLKNTTERPKRIMDLFYDRFFTNADLRQTPQRIMFDETFTLQFLGTMMGNGVSLMYLQAPQTLGNDTDDWKGKSIHLTLAAGTNGGDSLSIQPKLVWTIPAGGKLTESIVHDVPILQIHSIRTSASGSTQADAIEEDRNDEIENDEYEESDSNLCFITMTTKSGEVHVFEANSLDQRDEIVTGLKNVIARLTFHLVAGDAAASNELYREVRLSEELGDLPSLENPNQNMNRITHFLLDIA